MALPPPPSLSTYPDIPITHESNEQSIEEQLLREQKQRVLLEILNNADNLSMYSVAGNKSSARVALEFRQQLLATIED